MHFKNLKNTHQIYENYLINIQMYFLFFNRFCEYLRSKEAFFD